MLLQHNVIVSLNIQKYRKITNEMQFCYNVLYTYKRAISIKVHQRLSGKKMISRNPGETCKISFNNRAISLQHNVQ